MKPTDLSELKANATDMAGRLKIMSHPERLLMLCRLSEGEASVSELVDLTGLSQSSVSQHLAMLREEEVVSIRSEAQARFYQVKDDTVRAIVHSLCEICGEDDKACDVPPPPPVAAPAPPAPAAREPHKDWVEIARTLTGAVKDVRAGSPDVTKAFSAMAGAALKANALDTKTKELIALAISVAIRCDGCVAFHAEAAVKQGATREEVMEAMGMAIYMGAGPSLMYAAQAVEAFDQFSAKSRS